MSTCVGIKGMVENLRVRLTFTMLVALLWVMTAVSLHATSVNMLRESLPEFDSGQLSVTSPAAPASISSPLYTINLCPTCY